MKPIKLYALRHSDAAAPGEGRNHRDFDRPLTDGGRRKARRVGRGLRKLGLRFQLILSSPAVRARETAEIVAAALGAKSQLRFSDNLLIGGSRDRLYRELASLPSGTRRVLVVGHEPFLSNLVSHLMTGRTGLALKFRRAALCRLEVTELGSHPHGTLEWLATAKLLGAA